jgi:hypothetical protein
VEFITCARCRKTHGGPTLNLLRTIERGYTRSPGTVLESFCSVGCCDAHAPGTLRAEGVGAIPAALPGGDRFDSCSGCGAALGGWHTVYTVERRSPGELEAACIASLCGTCRPIPHDEA